MAYIGKQPIVGNFQKCDAITVVNGQAAYTLQVSSTNVTPESANHMLVSLNGILQAPITSFSIAGSTLTFVSNLATGDVIDFVILLGNVLDLGTPSDGTVTNAKLAQDIISGETALTAEPALTDELLLSDAGTLKRIDYSLISNTPSFLAYLGSTQNPSDATVTDVTMNTEAFDIGGCFNTSTYTFTPTTAGKYFLFTSIRAGSDTSRPAFIEIQARIRKNGGNCANQLLSSYSASNLDGFNANITTVVEANGSSDAFKVDFFGDVDAGTISLTSGQHQTYFGGYKLIGV